MGRLIIVDTNVISELMRPRPDPAVLRWFDGQDLSTVALTAVTVAELLVGVARLPDGERRRRLAATISAMIVEDFAGRVLAFDGDAAVEFAALTSDRDRRGRPIATPDAQIAAIARVHGAVVATRNTSDFLGTGVELVDPFAAA